MLSFFSRNKKKSVLVLSNLVILTFEEVNSSQVFPSQDSGLLRLADSSPSQNTNAHWFSMFEVNDNCGQNFNNH